MSAVESMSDAVAFIEKNLKEDIAIGDAADAVSHSVYHFCRVFNSVVRHTPYDYLMRRRLSESARELLETDRKIIDVAFDYRFNNPETYSRAFKRMFGMQPSAWRRDDAPRRWLLMPPATLGYLEHINKGDYLKPRFVEIDDLRVVGLMTVVKERGEAIPGLWEMLDRELEVIKPGVGIGDRYGIALYPEKWEEGSFFYVAAVATEIDQSRITDSPLVVKRLPSPMKCARFIHKGTFGELGFTLNYIRHTWLAKSGRQPEHSMEIARYGARFPAPDDAESESEIYIPITAQ